MEKIWQKSPHHHQHHHHHHQSPTGNIHSPALSQHLNQKIKTEEMEVDDPNAKQGTSPLLTSLLKSPSAAPNPSSSMLHNIPNQQTRVAAPTITNLLTGSVSNLTNSLAAAAAVVSTQQSGIKTIPSSVGSIATTYSPSMHSQPLTGPPPNDQLMNNIMQSPSQAAPTLSMLLENKRMDNSMKMPVLLRIDSQGSMCSVDQQSGSDIITKNEPTDADFNNAESHIKDEDPEQLMEVFGELPEELGDLADIILEDLINEEQVATVSNVVENESLECQANLDLKTFQSPTHSNEAESVKSETRNINENPCDSTSISSDIDSTFDDLKRVNKFFIDFLFAYFNFFIFVYFFRRKPIYPWLVSK